MIRWLPVLFILPLVGCGNAQQKLMPLDAKAVWTYQAEPGLQSETVDIKVSGQVPVLDVNGYQLTSTWGNSRLAWKGDILLASELGGTRYQPPIPLLQTIPKAGKAEWKGTISVADKSIHATATLELKDTEARIGSRDLPSTESVLTLKAGPDTHEILTWFVADYGIARQEQRKNGLLINRLTYLSGP